MSLNKVKLVVSSIYHKISNIKRFGLLVVFVLVSLVLLDSLPLVKQVFAASWYDSAWSYRAPITINNSSNPSTLTYYQVNVNLTSSNFDFSNALSDGSDLRVTDSDGTTVIPYWIESYDSGAQTASIWVNVPSIPASSSTTIYIYFGNASATVFDIPPAGPFEKLAGPLVTATGDGVLPENVVYDTTSSKYYMVLTDRQPSGGTTDQISLYESTDMETWTAYASNPILTGFGGLDSPHLMEHEGTWYLYYEQDQVVKLATAPSVTGTYTVQGTMLDVGGSGTWEDDRVTEVYVFERDDGVWMMFYMGDAGGFVEQVGYATASSPSGPWTKYANNPVIEFGESGSYDAGTVADPFVYKFGDTYYIYYAASSTINPPWVQAYATTKDFITFTKHNVVLGEGSQSSFDDDNAHRGALTKVGDYYYMTYAGIGALSPFQRFQAGIAKMYSKSDAQGYPPEQVFGLYEDFSGSTLPSQMRTEKFAGGNATLTVSSGILEMRSGTSSSIKPYNRLFSVQQFGDGHVLETRVQHPNAGGTGNFASGVGFGNGNFYPITSPFWTSGQFSNSASFADKNQSIAFGNGNSLRITSNMTVDTWVKVNNYSNQAANYIVAKHPGWAMYIGSNGSLNVFYNGATVIGAAGAFTSGDLGNWVHIAFTYDGSTTSIYKNGTALTTTGTFTSNIGTTASLFAGFRGDSLYFNGAIDELRISNNVRYSGNFTPPTEPYTNDANTAGLWHLDETSGSSVADSSSNSNTGTLTNVTGFNIHHYNASNWFKSLSNIVGTESAMSQALSTDYLTQRVWWKSSSDVSYQNDSGDWESITTDVPSTGTFPAWAMVISRTDNTSNGTLNIDWMRVRKYVETEPTLSVGNSEVPPTSPSPSASSSDNSSSSDSSSSPSAPTCSDLSPGAKAPWLYAAIPQSSSTVLLYFAEADGPLDSYALQFGTKTGEYPYGSTNIGGKETRTYLVQSLSPSTTYYFRVRAGNGCATGPWSNEITVSTSSLVSTNRLVITDSSLVPTESDEQKISQSCETHVVESGDTLWKIAQSLLGDGSKYQELIEENANQYPSLTNSSNLEIGWELKALCDEVKNDNTTDGIGGMELGDGYSVKVKVIDTENKPVEGAKVTIHSKVQEAVTDKDGIAQFNNVEVGQHKVIIAYDNYEGEQAINLTGDAKEFSLNVTVQPQNALLAPQVIAIISILSVVILSLVFLLLRSKNRSR